MKSIKLLKIQILVLLVFALLVSIASIIHGVFFDLEFEQIKRLAFQGLIFTLIVIFPSLIFLEWVFDLNNKRKFEEIEKRMERLEKKKYK